MMTVAERMHAWASLAVLTYGFRPLFLAAGTWAMLVWIGMITGRWCCRKPSACSTGTCTSFYTATCPLWSPAFVHMLSVTVRYLWRPAACNGHDG